MAARRMQRRDEGLSRHLGQKMVLCSVQRQVVVLTDAHWQVVEEEGVMQLWKEGQGEEKRRQGQGEEWTRDQSR